MIEPKTGHGVRAILHGGGELGGESPATILHWLDKQFLAPPYIYDRDRANLGD